MTAVMPPLRSLAMAIWLCRRNAERALRSTLPGVYRALRAAYRRAGRVPQGGAAHPESPSPSEVVIDDVRLRLDERLSPKMVSVLASGRHERQERQLIHSVLGGTDIVLELGTGIGLLSIICAKAVGSANVHTYEANPALEPLARANFALNEVDPKLTIGALGRVDGEMRLHIAADFWASSIYPSSDAEHVVSVPVQCFNDAVQRIRPTFLVIDIEGGEVDVLKDADLTTVQKIVMEIHPQFVGLRAANALRRHIRRSGFVELQCLGLCYLYARQLGAHDRRETVSKQNG